MDGKRRLPLLPAGRPDGPDDEREAKRAPWQWVGFGALAIFTVWVPLTAITGVLTLRFAASNDAADGIGRLGILVVGLQAAALALGSLAGGFVVGRWGGEGVGVREATLAGMAAALVAVAAAWATSGFSAGALLVAVIAASSAAAGGAWGVGARARAR